MSSRPPSTVLLQQTQRPDSARVRREEQQHQWSSQARVWRDRQEEVQASDCRDQRQALEVQVSQAQAFQVAHLLHSQAEAGLVSLPQVDSLQAVPQEVSRRLAFNHPRAVVAFLPEVSLLADRGALKDTACDIALTTTPHQRHDGSSLRSV
jgi:hypothetical protein